MTEGQRKAVYSAAAAILAALGAWGIVDAATQDQILQVVQGGLTALMAVIPLLAHRKVGASGVDDPVAVVATDPGMTPPADVVDETDPGMTPPADDEPRHAEEAPTADEVEASFGQLWAQCELDGVPEVEQLRTRLQETEAGLVELADLLGGE